MSRPSSRLRLVIALVVTLVVSATVLAPVTADAQDVRTLTASVTTDGPASLGHNQTMSWNVEVSCAAEVGECGNAVIESQLAAGITVTDIDTTMASGYVVVTAPEALSAPGGPTVVQLQRAGDLLDGEIISFVVHGRVHPEALQGAMLDHIVLVGSTSAPTASAVAAPIVVANASDWQPLGFATGEATLGRNETHRVAVCGSTEANTAHGELALEVAFPDGTVVVDAADAETTPTGLRWSLPEVTSLDLADEHTADLAAGRTPTLCHEFFPTLRWGAPDFAIGQPVPIALTLTGPSGESVDALCPLGCRLDVAPALVGSTTIIEPQVTGPESLNAGGLATWTVTFDASATVEEVQVPLLDVTLPAGLQLERLDVTELGAGVEADIHASIDGGQSFAPLPVRTTEAAASLLNRDSFDAAVGSGMAIDALQIRLVSTSGDPVLAAGQQPRLALITSPRADQPPAGVAELCALATSANAASLQGQGCVAAAVAAAAAVFGPATGAASPAAPTDDHVVTTTIRVPTSNGAPIIDPVVGALLPAGFEFRGLDLVTASDWLGDVPRPLVEVEPDSDGTGRTRVVFRWADQADGSSASHTIQWTPTEMRTALTYEPVDVVLTWRIAAPAGHPVGAALLDVAATSLVAPPLGCPEGSIQRDDALGLGTALVCGAETTIETSSGASLVQGSLAAGVQLLPAVSLDPLQTWCETTRVDDIDWVAEPCAAPSTPNGRVQFQTDITNTGNRELTELWSYGLLPSIDDTGIDPATWETPRESEWAASLTGPLVVSGLPWEPVEADDVIVEYSMALDPCRSELNVAMASWPPGCVDDWTSTPGDWAAVRAWRAHVPFDRVPFAGGTSIRVEGELLVAADADFETAATAAVSTVALDPFENAWVAAGVDAIAVAIPREDEILAADPGLLPYDLALTAAINPAESVDLHDGPQGDDGFVVDVEIVNQGAPVDSIDVALHLGDDVVAEATSGSALTDDAGSISWTVTPGNPAMVSVTGSLGRADTARIPVELRIATTWSGDGAAASSSNDLDALEDVLAAEDFASPNGLGLIAEIARFGAAGAPATLVDHDSLPDLEPGNDVAPARAGSPGDNVTSGDGQPDSGAIADPVADDEDDHDLAEVPLWDLAISVGLADTQPDVLAWDDPTATWLVEVMNAGDRDAYDVTVEQRLPAGMTWTLTAEATDADIVLSAEPDGRVTIAHLPAGSSATWTASAVVTDTTMHDFAFEAEMVTFSDDAAPETDDSALVRDRDGDDLVASVGVALPWDLAVSLEHRSTVGLPVHTDTEIEVGLVVENVGRSVGAVLVDVDLAGAGAIAQPPDLALSIVDESGNPIRMLWDLSDPASPRIQVERSDGVSMAHGSRVVVPVQLSVVDPSVDLNVITVGAAVTGFEAGELPIVAIERIDSDESNDQDELVVPMWDMALSFIDDTPTLRTIGSEGDGEDEVVADWGIRVENQGNRDATDIVVDIDLGDRLTAASDTTVSIPFLAAGEHVELHVVSQFVDGYDGEFAVSAQVMSFSDVNRVARSDGDSRPGQIAAIDEPGEDDEAHIERELPVALEVSLAHVATSTLPIVPGETTATFEVSVVNVGRPVHEVELALDAGVFGPLLIDASDASFDVVAGDRPGIVVVQLPADAPLMPDATLSLPVTVQVPREWDGTIPSLSAAFVNDDDTLELAEGAATAVPMSVWDLALEVTQPATGGLVPGEPVEWELTVRNEGNRDAHNVTIAVAVPDGMAWNGLVGVGASTADIGSIGEIEIMIDVIGAGERADLRFVTELVATDRSRFRLAAEIASFDADADPANGPNPLARDIDSTPRHAAGIAASAALAIADPANLDAAGPEDDQDHADATLLADVAIAVEIDPTTPPRAGAASTWNVSVTNQGLDLSEASLAFELDDRWSSTDLAALPAFTTGSAALAVSWDVSDPTMPRAQLVGPWPNGTVAEFLLELTTAEDASADGTPLRFAASVNAVDDDGFPATPPPVLDDVAGDAVDLVELDLFDLALSVRLDASVALPPPAESDVTFIVEVTNQGTVPADDVSVRLHPDADHWQPLTDTSLQIVDAAAPLAAGAQVAIPVTLTLAADADLDVAALIAEIEGSSTADFDSVADADPANDSAPAAAGDATDDVVDNRLGDEDDHDVAGLQPLSWVLGNQVWFDADRDGIRDDDEAPAAGVLIELLLDANGDGVADDRDLSGTIDADDRLTTTTTDADGLFRFDEVAAGSYLVAIPSSEFAASGPLVGWSATIVPTDASAGDTLVDGANVGRIRSDGGVTSQPIVVGATAPLGEVPNNAEDFPDSRTDLTIDFGLGQWSLGDQVWYDTIENGLFEAGEEEGVAKARLYVFVDADDDGTADDVDRDGKLTIADALATTIADAAGRYRFDGLGAGTYVVAVADVTMRGTLGDWTPSASSRAVEPGRDNDSNIAGWSGQHVVSAPIRLGDGPAVDLTLDFGFELAEVAPIVWPDVDLTGFNNPTSFGGTTGPDFFGPTPGDALNDLDGFGDVDLFVDDGLGELGDSFDFVGDEFFEEGPAGPLAYTGSNSRTLISWAAMLIVFGAVLVGVSRDPDET